VYDEPPSHASDTMRRLQLFEFGDQSWLPATLRNASTDFLQQLMRSVRLYEQVVPIVERMLALSGERHVVDLCSGGAGPWAYLGTRDWDVSVTLTDKYPNIPAFEHACRQAPGRLNYRAEAVDATRVPSDLKGARTIFTGFHHFAPDEARAVLANAVEQRSAIGVFEFTERRVERCLVDGLAIPLLTLALTPAIRPQAFSRLFWTYAVPVVPCLILWDGVVSNLRTYSAAELQALGESVENEGYAWESGQIAVPSTRAFITYLVGCPVGGAAN
jgi:hypothetical protein